MKTFVSNALGSPHEYHMGLVGTGILVGMAKIDLGASLPCRTVSADKDRPYLMIHHNSVQVRQVLKDHDIALAEREHPV